MTSTRQNPRNDPRALKCRLLFGGALATLVDFTLLNFFQDRFLSAPATLGASHRHAVSDHRMDAGTHIFLIDQTLIGSCAGCV